MSTLSLFIGRGEIAAAVAVEGELRSAVRRRVADERVAGVRDALEPLVETCCRVAGLDIPDLDRIVQVDEAHAAGWSQTLEEVVLASTALRWDHVSVLEAQLEQLGAATSAAAVLVVLDPRGSAVARKMNGRPACVQSLDGVDGILAAGRSLAEALGARGGKPLSELQAIARSHDAAPFAGFDRIVQLAPAALSLTTDLPALIGLIERAQSQCTDRLADPLSVHASVVRVRASLAKGYLGQLADVVAALGERCRKSVASGRLAFGGSLLSTPELAGEIRRRLGEIDMAPLLDDCGLAIGAALAGTASPDNGITHLALGPRFEEEDIKRTLENCRLEYVYEPDWARLFDRVSRWMTSGSSVAWYQGAVDFGTRSLGSRSILADPANRYARENLNVYLLGRPVESPLPVSLAPSGGADCVDEGCPGRFMQYDCHVAPTAQAGLASALDRDARCVLQIPSARTAPEFTGILEAHRARTGHPGLINLTLEASPGHLAETPRDAIRTAFGSAVDVLVIGRFLVGKDYWLMRQMSH